MIGDLNAPRGIAFDADGNLIVAVAGSGGETELVLPSPEGETTMILGMTGKIVSVAPDGTATDVSAGFPSYAAATETIGLYRAIMFPAYAQHLDEQAIRDLIAYLETL